MATPALGVTGLTYAVPTVVQEAPTKNKALIDVASVTAGSEDEQEHVDDGPDLFADCPALFSFSFTSIFQLTEAESNPTPISWVGANKPYYLLFHSLRIPSR